MEWIIERLTLAMSAAQLGFWDWDIEHQVLEWSPQTERMFGHEPGTMTHSYETWIQQLHPDDRPQAEAAVQQALQDHRDFSVEYRIGLPNGNERWIEAHGHMIVNSQQQPMRMVGLVRDITHRKDAIAALAASESRFRAVFEQAAVGMARLAPDGRWIEVNQTLCDFLGYTREELLQRSFQDITDPVDATSDEQIYQELLSGRAKTYQFEKRYLSKAGDSLWSLVTVSNEYAPDGKLVCFIAVIEDIRTKKQAEQELHQRADELGTMNMMLAQTTALLEQRNQELDQFAYVASHDLKAPLRAIANLSEWIEEDLTGQLPEENQRQLKLLRSRVRRMEDMINGLLSYSRVGRSDRLVETVDVAHLLADVIDSIAPPSSFRFELPTHLPTLTTQRIALHQVLANLIGNAIKHHDRDDGTITIAVEMTRTGYEFTVTDDGPGIDPRYHDKVFAIFQTLKARDELESTGIGLAIVKKIVEAQGGTIHLESEPGNGSRFKFTWPQ